MTWFHLRELIQWKGIDQSKVVSFLKYLLQAIEVSIDEVRGGEPSKRSNIRRDHVLVQFATAYMIAGGQLAFGCNEAYEKQSKFLLFLFELNTIAKREGASLAVSDGALAEAARRSKELKSLKVEPL